MKIETLKKEIKNINEPRRTRYGNIRHKLEDIIIIGLCTVICGGEDYADMEEFGTEREEYLRKFLELPNGIPDSDTFRRVFERIDPTELSICLVNWLSVEREKRSVIAVDGKTICGSGNNEHKAYHVVSAFVAENQITLGEIAVNEKTNEITAVPELLELIDIEGAIVTADAMNYQKKIAEKIIAKNADYTLGLKSNQRMLYDDVADYFSEFSEEVPLIRTSDKGHGRIERREYRLLTDVSWLEQKDEWAGLQSVGMVRSVVIEHDEKREFIRYFIISLIDINEFAYSVRKHWSIENQLHWCLDVIFSEDSSRARKDNSPLNMNVLRKTALSLLNQAKYGRISKKKMMFKAALNPEVLLNILFSSQK
ncbi:MAG: ISAs1 family transposase [Christensenellaceae bacterium]|nr:ISAs1 family transposase [Christensenellaceae bacterium]